MEINDNANEKPKHYSQLYSRSKLNITKYKSLVHYLRTGVSGCPHG